MAKKYRKENIELIKIVQNEEAVYNPQKRSLSSKSFVDDFWMATDIRLNKNPGESLEKWTLLRAYFCNEHRKVNLGFGTKWVYYDAMKFLIPYLRRNTFSPKQVPDEIVRNALNDLDGVTRSTLKNPIEDAPHKNDTEEDTPNILTIQDEKIVESKNETSMEAWSDEHFDDYSNFETQNTVEEIVSSPTEIEYQSNYFAEHSETIEYIEIPEKLHQNINQQTEMYQGNPSSPSVSSELCSCKTNPDAMFLLSLLPDIQSLSKKDKGQFKLTVQKLLQDMLYPNNDS